MSIITLNRICNKTDIAHLHTALHSHNMQCASIKVHSFTFLHIKHSFIYKRSQIKKKLVIFTAFQLHQSVLLIWLVDANWATLANQRETWLGTITGFFREVMWLFISARQTRQGREIQIFAFKRTSVHENKYDKSGDLKNKQQQKKNISANLEDFSFLIESETL